MQNALFILLFAFGIVHSALCISPCTPSAFLQRRVPVDGHVRPFLDTAARPQDPYPWRLHRLAEAGEHARIVGGSVAPVGPGAPPQRQSVAALDGDTRTEHVTGE